MASSRDAHWDPPIRTRRIDRRTLVRGIVATAMTPLLAGALAACGGESDDSSNPNDRGGGGDVQLTGSGSSFVDPILQVWIDQYRSVAPEVEINYQAVGSGQGKRDFIIGVTDFGSTDAPMTDEEIEQEPSAFHVPVIVGAVAVIYNLPDGIEVRLTGPTLADIYLGKITRWDDPVIVAENPDVDLPDFDIGVISRSDGSGTTAIFTNFLSKVSPEWEEQVGAGTAVQWPLGIGAEKNPGVTAAVLQTPGGIGYVETIFAVELGVPMASIQNATGAFIAPDIEAVSAAAAGFLSEIPDDLRISITNPPEGEDAYPIAGFTWILVRGAARNATKARALAEFLYWILTEGDDAARALHYSPVPDPIKERAFAMLAQVEVDGTPVFDPGQE